MTLEESLRKLLSETPREAEARCRQTWMHLAGADTPPLILFGAGNLGRKMARALRACGWNLLGFADNSSAKWGTQVEGVPVFSPQEAIARGGASVCFVVSIWQGLGSHRFRHTRQQLLDLGANHVVHAGHLGWRLPEALLPYYSMDHPRRMVENRDAVLRAMDLWQDGRSRDLFIRLALWRLNLDFDLFPEPDEREEYLAQELFPAREGELLIDGGAFDGDTAARFLDLWPFRDAVVHAFEPDPHNILKFEARFKNHPERDRIRLSPLALSASEGQIAFDTEGTDASAANPESATLVPCSTLDKLFRDTPFSFLKLDIEGAEMDALRGGASVIQKNRPRLAICVYHCQAHLWEIPNFVHGLLPDSRLSLVNHGVEGWDVVMYADPDGSGPHQA